VSSFAGVTKGSAAIAAAAVAALLIGVHPDMTAGLRGLCTLAAVVGWLAAGSARPGIHALWVAAAILSPAPLRVLTSREGPVLDLFWMAGLTASLLRTTPWGRWALDEDSRLLAGAWALTLALAWPILAARELAFDPRLAFDVGAVNAWTLWSAPHVVSWIGFIAWSHLLGLLWLDWLAARLADRPDRAPGVLHALWIASTLASLIAVYQGLVDLSLFNTGFWVQLKRASGTLLDANAYGVCAALAGPSAIIALRGSGWRRAGPITAAVTAVNLAGLWMSGSRVAALCGVIALAAVGLAIWREPGGRRRRVVAIAGACAVVAAIVVLASGAAGPARRLFDRASDAPGGFAAVILMRPPYGPIANQIIRDYPLTGVGIGAYQHLAADYRRRDADQVLTFDHAQNWWRQQAAELGLVGALPLFLWSALIAWQVAWTRPRDGRVFTSTIVRGQLLALGICSVIQIPTQTPIVLLWFLLLVAWLPSLNIVPAVTSERARRVLAPALACAAIAYAAGHLVLGRGQLAVTARANTFQREYVSGAYAAEPTPEGGMFRWTDDHSRFVWPTPTRWFVIQMWAYHPDIAQNPVRVTITTPCGLLVEHVLSSPEQRSIGITLPEGQTTLDATIAVSRTWRPSTQGGGDSRRLGVGISAGSVASAALVQATHVPVDLKGCPAAL
jgi:hypothetical protein